jgi:glutamine cyclotransferase
MPFGRLPLNFIMKNKLILLIVPLALSIYSCQNKNQENAGDITISPESGTSYKSGDAVNVKISYPAAMKPDSVVYLLDSVRLISKKDSSAFSFKTDTMPLGAKVITAKVYQSGKSQDASTNIVLMAAKAPEDYTFKVIKTFPHDTSSYTEGLIYQDGVLYESGGGRLKTAPDEQYIGQSSLREEDLNTGKVLKKTMVDPKVFGEGIAIVGNKIIQLTWTEKIRYIYDKDSFKLLSTQPNNIGVEGWGMTSDGTKLYMDDSTNRIWFIDKDKWAPIGYIDVYDDKGPIDSLNELEYIDGKIYANVYTKDYIVVIDPKTGAVLEKIDMSTLFPQPRKPPADVMNGIAYDEKGKRIFVTGKKWPHLYQVSFVKK